jgi:antitoxin HicB
MSTTASGHSQRSEPATSSDTPRYSMLIEWSDEDHAYLVRLPEWEQGGNVLGPVTHGDSYDEAARNGTEALESLIASWHDLGWVLPAPHMHVATVAGGECRQ